MPNDWSLSLDHTERFRTKPTSQSYPNFHTCVMAHPTYPHIIFSYKNNEIFKDFIHRNMHMYSNNMLMFLIYKRNTTNLIDIPFTHSQISPQKSCTVPSHAFMLSVYCSLHPVQYYYSQVGAKRHHTKEQQAYYKR